MRGWTWLIPCAALIAACTGSAGDGNGAEGGAAGTTPSGAGGASSSAGGASPGIGGNNTGGTGLVGAGGTRAAGGSGGNLGPTGGGGTPGAGGATGTGGASSAGGATGTAGATGAAGSTPLSQSYYLGADITFVQADEASGTTYTDTDGVKKDILTLLKGHGFNYIRLRTFFDPRAADGYDKINGYADLAHTITFGQRIKAAGMGFLLDFHYSDNWADPGKQCVPIAWQSLTTIAALAQAVHDYTKDAITQLVAAQARPDMVQIGNEITPGMLIHRCNAAGTPTGNNPITGAISNWTNLGMLLRNASAGVKEVDPAIKVMIHIDRGGDKPTDVAGSALSTSMYWLTNATAQQVPFDVFGESSYQDFQGDINNDTTTVAGWTNTFTHLAMLNAIYPNLKFVAAEYGLLERQINDVLFNLPTQLGSGTFIWEPTRTGAGNTDAAGKSHALFTRNGVATADLALYDLMKTAYAGRL